MKKILSILMISILLLVSIPYASAERNIQIGEPFKLHDGENEAVFYDGAIGEDNEAILLELELGVSAINPERRIEFGNGDFRFFVIIPASTSVSWSINTHRPSNRFIFWVMGILHILIDQEAGDVINIDDKYNLHILRIQNEEDFGIVELRLDRRAGLL